MLHKATGKHRQCFRQFCSECEVPGFHSPRKASPSPAPWDFPGASSPRFISALERVKRLASNSSISSSVCSLGKTIFKRNRLNVSKDLSRLGTILTLNDWECLGLCLMREGIHPWVSDLDWDSKTGRDQYQGDHEIEGHGDSMTVSVLFRIFSQYWRSSWKSECIYLVNRNLISK